MYLVVTGRMTGMSGKSLIVSACLLISARVCLCLLVRFRDAHDMSLDSLTGIMSGLVSNAPGKRPQMAPLAFKMLYSTRTSFTRPSPLFA
jgi:hypothetical protein